MNIFYQKSFILPIYIFMDVPYSTISVGRDGWDKAILFLRSVDYFIRVVLKWV